VRSLLAVIVLLVGIYNLNSAAPVDSIFNRAAEMAKVRDQYLSLILQQRKARITEFDRIVGEDGTDNVDLQNTLEPAYVHIRVKTPNRIVLNNITVSLDGIKYFESLLGKASVEKIYWKSFFSESIPIGERLLSVKIGLRMRSAIYPFGVAEEQKEIESIIPVFLSKQKDRTSVSINAQIVDEGLLFPDLSLKLASLESLHD